MHDLPLAAAPMWVYQVPTLIFAFCFGACVGSFLNVLVYRLPAGMGIVSPPSRCPICGAKLKFFTENLPIIGWFYIRGKCRYCGTKVSIQYMLVELFMALLFLGLYVWLFMANRGDGWFQAAAPDWWSLNTAVRTWPALVAWAFLAAGLVAMTMIDARTFTIPNQIPTFITITAFIAYPLQALLPVRIWTIDDWPIPAVGWAPTLASTLGLVGVLIGLILLRTGRLKYSFADYDDYLPEGGQGPLPSTAHFTALELAFILPCLIGFIVGPLTTWWIGVLVAVAIGLAVLLADKLGVRFLEIGEDPDEETVLAHDYPHARREVLREMVFLLPCIIGLVVGFWLGATFFEGPPPRFVQAVGATFTGYIAGGGIVWAIRILGSLAFGKEAMGLGDVHLLAAVGAVLGWVDPLLIFVMAPVSGLLWMVIASGLGGMFKSLRQAMPYGPHLALMAFALVLLRPGIEAAWMAWFPEQMALPQPGFLTTPVP